MDINQARNHVLNIARKNQLGSFKPSELDLYFQRAQIDIINELRANYEWTSLISDQLSKLVTQIEVFNTGEKFNKPQDYMYWVDFFAFNYTNKSCGDVAREWTPIELITQNKLAYRASSSIVKADTNNPVAVNFPDYFLVLPTPSKIILTYVREPRQPVWAYTTNSNQTLSYDAINSQQLELPDSLHDLICNRVLNYMGLSTRDSDLYQATAK